MIRAALALACVLVAAPAVAEETSQKVTIAMTVEQAHLIVQTLGAIGCQTVTQLVICDQAKELLAAIREQVKGQSK